MTNAIAWGIGIIFCAVVFSALLFIAIQSGEFGSSLGVFGEFITFVVGIAINFYAGTYLLYNGIKDRRNEYI